MTRLLLAAATTVAALAAVYLTRPTHRLPCGDPTCTEEH